MLSSSSSSRSFGGGSLSKSYLFSFNNLHETFCCLQHASLSALYWLLGLCDVYIAFAFDKVNQKFFNPFCIHANIDTYTYIRIYIQTTKKGSSASCVLIILPSLTWSWTLHVLSHFERAAKLWRSKVNFINLKLFIYMFVCTHAVEALG